MSSVTDHANAWWSRVMYHARAAVDDPDPEHIHQFRTHLRRLRSLEGHLRKQLPDPPATPVRTTLRSIALRTSQLRDYDVLMAERRAWLGALPPALSDGGREVWFYLETDRARARELVDHYLVGDHFRGQRLSTERALPMLFADPDGVLDRTLRRAVGRQHRKLLKAARRFDASTPPARWHKLRITAKKLRYGLEACPPQPARDTLLKVLKRLQRALGDYNDLAVQQLLLEDLTRHEWSAPALQAMGAWRLWLHREQKRLHPQLPAALERYAVGRSSRLLAAVAEA